MSIIKHAPLLSLERARGVAEKYYDLDIVSLTPLPSERDQNFVVATSADKKYVLKIANGLDDRELLVAQNAMMQHIGKSIDLCPQVIPSKSGSEVFEVEIDESKHFVRLISFRSGVPMAELGFRSPELLVDLGAKIGQLRTALADFDHAAFHRDFHWDLANARKIVEEKTGLISDEDLKATIEKCTRQYDLHVAPIIQNLPQSVIHNDANDGNVIVSHDAVVGIIDFGDVVYSWSVGELAIAIAYSILNQADPLSCAAKMVAASHAESPLQELEIQALFGLICLRLCVSAILAAEQSRHRPQDPYLTVSQIPIQQTLPELAAIPYKIATATFRQACGLQAVEYNAPEWLAQKRAYAFPIKIREQNSQPVVLDLSVTSNLMPQDLSSVSISRLTEILFAKMKESQAGIGVGRYLEPRLVYQSEQFGIDDLEQEARTIHLGIDLFAPADVPVTAVMDGTVHCVVEINKPLDYGHLVILKHEPKGVDPFFTLYGHLSHQTLEQVQKNQAVKAGEMIGWLGAEHENGGWPPHLHFQIMLDMLDFEDDFPGVCFASQQKVWSEFCPDPNLILGLPQDIFPPVAPSKQSTLQQRKIRTGTNLSIGYRQPVKAVKGWKHWLYDESGRKYLDAYNNVPHVGHCHPDVVQALTDQARLLNTNTRYLNDGLNEFSEKLAATMPDPLNVCYFLNSASEANELALRMARTYTGQKDLIVLEGAYHGHSTTLIDISPYKHDGPGGNGPADWVHTAPLADSYRGQFKDPQTAAVQYADCVGAIIDQIRETGKGVCGFIAESCPSVGGQIIFPEGYLPKVYEYVRRVGGVCIADDVQTGYGRLGSAFYGFELQNVVPDIVVLGKPMGNGHPIAAVITNREIATAFDNGMEFFSTFGGNSVSCKVGLAVLDVVLRGNLQSAAATTGEFMKSELNKLKSKHHVIGDVRGSGLFLGVELVRDRESLEPADQEASFVVNRMRDRNILIGTDGPLHNVIKIRPPMTFGIAEATTLIVSLDRCFEEVVSSSCLR